MEKSLEKIIAQRLIQTNPGTQAALHAFKRRIAKEYGIAYPTNIALIASLNNYGNDTGCCSANADKPPPAV